MKYARIKHLILAASVALTPIQGFGFESRIHVPGTDSFNDLAYTGMAQNRQSAFTIRIHVSCFGVTKKPVYNPISPTGSMHFSTSIAAVPFGATFPVWLMKRLTGNSPQNLQVIDLKAPPLTPGGPPLYAGSYYNIQSGYGEKNLVVLRASVEPGIAVIDALGSYPPSSRTNAIDYIRFRYDQQRGNQCPPGIPVSWCTQQQTAWNEWDPEAISKGQESIAKATNRLFLRPMSILFSGLAYAGLPNRDDRYRNKDFDEVDLANPWGRPDPLDPQFTAADREVGYMVKVHFSSDLKLMEIDASFPSIAPGWCGAHYCPLMLFFNKKRPQFRGISQFKLNANGVTNWPEENAPGHFLALDRNGDGVINDVSELFGDMNPDNNGFELLRPYDFNRDNLVNAQDPIYSKLLLWRDQNSDGISQKEELKTLIEMGVSEISLNYDNTKVNVIGKRAELRERAPFKFVGIDGRERLGEVVDVWLSDDR